MTEALEQQYKLDEKWYGPFKEVGSFAAWEYLLGDKTKREEERRKFLAGEVRNPTLDYPKLLSEDWKQREEKLLHLKQNVINQEPNETVKQAYRWKINEKIAAVRMMQAATRGDFRRFMRYSTFIYGRPSAEIFAFTIQGLQDGAKRYLNADNPVISQAAQIFLNVLPTNLSDRSTFSLPNEEMLQRAKGVTFREFGDLINLPVSEGALDVNVVRSAFDRALKQKKIGDWQVIEAASFAVSQENRQIRISAVSSLQKLKQLIFHEFATHLLKRVSGERSRLMLLGLGLDRFGRGDEGIATMREQVFKDKIEDFAGLDGHLAISLAMGLDGKPRDFRDVFEILEKYYLFKKLITGKDPVVAFKNAQKKAYNRCVRTFRGTDCSTPGICFLGDVEYREGNIGVWEVIRTKPEEMVRFSVGKYDPANPRHLWILEQLGITEKDLQELEK